MKLAAVILNYNDAEGTVDAVKRINGFFCFDAIVVVDNASTDDSAEILERELSGMGEKVQFLRSAVNGGYGSGNTIGIRYAHDVLGADLTVVANPDAVFSEKLVCGMRDVFEQDADTAAVGAVMHNGDDHKVSYREYMLSGWKRRSLAGFVMNGGPITSRLFRKYLNYPFHYYSKGRERAVPVYAVHGSLLMLSAEKFLACGGYDENIFLYCEENVLAEKFVRAGYKTYLLRDIYRHSGSHSITGSGHGAVKRQQFRNESENYFYQHYLGAGKAAMLLIRLFQSAVMLETKILEKVL